MDDKVTSRLIKLQYDLENSLCHLTKKYNVLSRKISSTTFHEMKEKPKASDVGQRRVSISDPKPYKKTKLSSEKSQKSSFSARAKSKRTQPAKSQENKFPEKTSDIPKIQKSDTLNRFWAYFDSYCTDISMDDISVLEKWIESHNRDFECQNIPELGVHYSSKWMEDEALEDIKEGSKSMENPKGIDCISEENSFKLKLLREKTEEKINISTNSEYVPLIGKLRSSLVQENIITSDDMMSETIPDDECQEKEVEGPASLLNENILKNRIILQLKELGILETNINETVDDELLQELKRLQSLLIPVAELNLQKKKTLLLRAKAEIAKQEAQKRIQEADAKVMESYRAMTAARLKGKKLGKKELSQIRIMLEERDALIKNTMIES